MPEYKGGYHINPQVARMHEGAPPIKKSPDPGTQEDQPKSIEVHQGPHPEHPEAKFHTIAHPGEEVKGHETLHEAHHAVNEHMGGSDHDLHDHPDHEEPDGDEVLRPDEAGADAY